MFGSILLVERIPKFLLPLGPISQSSAMPSPLVPYGLGHAATFARLQPGYRPLVAGLSARSNQGRTSLSNVAAVYRSALSMPTIDMYRFHPPFTAVLPLPNRSYAALSRGLKSGPRRGSLRPGSVLAGLNRPRRFGLSGIDCRATSIRRPRLSVNRLIVHESCPKMPRS